MRRLTVTLLTILLFVTSAFMEGSPAELNKGVGILTVDKKLSEIKSYLVKADTSKLISINKKSVGLFYTAWTVNLKQAKLTDYFGLKITSIEVYSEVDEDEMGNTVERVREFVIFVTAPKDSAAKEKFRQKIWEKYGVPQNRMFSPDFSECVYDSWYNEENDRMLDLIYGIDIATGNKLGYYEANYQ